MAYCLLMKTELPKKEFSPKIEEEGKSKDVATILYLWWKLHNAHGEDVRESNKPWWDCTRIQGQGRSADLLGLLHTDASWQSL